MPKRSRENRRQQNASSGTTAVKDVDLSLLNKVSCVDNIAILVQFEGSVMRPLILVALMLRLPVLSVSIQTELVDVRLEGRTSWQLWPFQAGENRHSPQRPG